MTYTGQALTEQHPEPQRRLQWHELPQGVREYIGQHEQRGPAVMVGDVLTIHMEVGYGDEQTRVYRRSPVGTWMLESSSTKRNMSR